VSECECVLEPGACLHALVVVVEIVVPDVELLEIGHRKNSFSVSSSYEIYNSTNYYKKLVEIITTVTKIITKFQQTRERIVMIWVRCYG
jgi:hypothetical protein